MPHINANIISASEFGKVFSEFKVRFAAIAYRYVRDMNTAEDLVSDSFMAFWEARERLPADVNIPAYILTSVKNRCLNHLSSKLRHIKAEQNIYTTRQRLLQADIRSLSACNPDELFSEEIEIMLERAVRKMSEMTRKVFLHSRVDGKTYKEIAKELNISVSHVNFEIRKGLEILREELKDYLPVIAILLLLYPNIWR